MRIRRSTTLYETSESVLYIVKWALLSVLVGAVVGIAAVAFTGVLNGSIVLLSPIRQGNLLYILPAIGLLLSGLVTTLFAPEAAGHGTDAVIRSYVQRWGRVSLVAVPVKLIASVFTIAFGGSAGREGPTVQMGGGLAYWVGRTLNLSLRDIQKLVVCGMGAAFGSIFTAPIAGGVFGAEVLYRDDMEYNNLFVSFISSLTAFFVYSVLMGRDRLFAFSPPVDFVFVPHRDIVYFVLVGVGVGVVGMIFIKFLYGFEYLSHRLTMPVYLRTAVGGLLTGLTALLISPDILGTGMSLLERLILEPTPVMVLAALTFGKMSATSFTIGSGGSGGVVAPSLTMGAMTGAMIAQITGYPFPPVVLAAGSVGLLGSAAHIPITTAILAAELYGFALMKPATIVCFIGAWVTRRDSLFRQALVSRSERARGSHHFDRRPL